MVIHKIVLQFQNKKILIKKKKKIQTDRKDRRTQKFIEQKSKGCLAECLKLLYSHVLLHAEIL